MLALKLCQWQAKYEMSHKLKLQQKTESLAFHKSFFKERLQRGSEFDWDNKRYDVVNASYEADSVFIDAINDTREKGILHYIGKFMHQQNKQGKNPSKISTLSLLVFQAPLPETLAIVAPINQVSFDYFYKNLRISKMYSLVKSPPPRILLG
jgi:hypothetical protein